MSNQPTISRNGFLLFVAIVGVSAFAAMWMYRSENSVPKPVPDSPAPVSFAIPPFSRSQFLNVGPEAQYVGSAACAVCHTQNHKSYLLTPHSRAFIDLEPKVEPPDGSYEHKPSGRSYRVYRKDGQLRHQEELKTEDGKEVAGLDLPIRFLVGSGHFTRSYVIEVDGFLQESPITWYTARQRWDMSPGYDIPQHGSFERQVTVGCVACHAGRVEEKDGAIHRLTVHEKAIGCENCHGPGSIHRELHVNRKLAPGEPDLTIVHPGKLPRSLQESICAACHLSNTAMVPVRGREPHEYRPGRPLSDYRVRYRFSGSANQMTVVGHVEQLRLSACYQKSPSLSCVSCHDPHQNKIVQDKAAVYRGKCMECHGSHPCKLDPKERSREADNCVTCHMPRGDTEIPHLAFTHHRIGRHNAKPVKDPGQALELVTDDDLTHMGPLDQQRNLGLAYLKLSRSSSYAFFAENFRWRAINLLDGAAKAGMPDAEVDLALAELYSETDPPRARTYAQKALEQKASPTQRASALAIIFDQDFQARNYPAAIKSLESLTHLRRNAEDWRYLGTCYLSQNDPGKALPAFQNALAIRPYRAAIDLGLEELYRKRGDVKKADEYKEKARWLQLHHQN